MHFSERKDETMPTKPRAKYVVDANGHRVGIIIPIKEYEAMLQELEDFHDAKYVEDAEKSSEGFVELSDLESIRAYDAAKTSKDEAIPFDQAIDEIEHHKK